MQGDIVAQGGVAVVENPHQGAVDQVGCEAGQDCLSGQGIVDAVLEYRTVWGVGKAVGVGPARKGAAFLDIPKHQAGNVFNVAGVPLVRPGTGVHGQNHPAPRIETAGSHRYQVFAVDRNNQIGAGSTAVTIVKP